MGFLYSQFFVKPAVPTSPLDGQTLIVTGSNTGLGLTAAEHIARLNPAHLILAVRNASKGATARDRIIESTKISPSAISVWQLDMSSYESVLAFADRCAKELDRLDGITLNAGISTGSLELFEGYESTITVNVISTMLLALALQPTLVKSAEKYKITPRISFVASEVHAWAPFAEKTLPKDTPVLHAMSQPDKAANMGNSRYMDSKLLEILLFRYVQQNILTQSKNTVVWNILNPGWCYSELSRDNAGLAKIAEMTIGSLLKRTTEVGGRTLASGLVAGKESNGEYMHDGVVDDSALSSYVKSKDGGDMGKRLWEEVKPIYERVRPGITKGL